MADVTLARTHASVCPPGQHHSAAAPRLNRAIVAWVVKAGPCNLEQLDEIFGPPPDAPNPKLALEHFRHRLARLVSVGYLSTNGLKDRHRLWSAGPNAPQPEKPPTPPWVGQIVPAREVDVMVGPVYVPPRMVCPRAGGLDFKRVASRGHAC